MESLRCRLDEEISARKVAVKQLDEVSVAHSATKQQLQATKQQLKATHQQLNDVNTAHEATKHQLEDVLMVHKATKQQLEDVSAEYDAIKQKLEGEMKTKVEILECSYMVRNLISIYYERDILYRSGHYIA